MTNKVDETTAKSCENEHNLCAFWAGSGECNANEEFMNMDCGPSCQVCPITFGIDDERVFASLLKDLQMEMNVDGNNAGDDINNPTLSILLKAIRKYGVGQTVDEDEELVSIKGVVVSTIVYMRGFRDD